jgi:hypothetical protein
MVFDFEEKDVNDDGSARQSACLDESDETDWIHEEKELAAVLVVEENYTHMDHHHTVDKVREEDTLEVEPQVVVRIRKSACSDLQPKHDSKGTAESR